jgi:uncharacterized MAPEG superfamily protein
MVLAMWGLYTGAALDQGHGGQLGNRDLALHWHAARGLSLLGDGIGAVGNARAMGAGDRTDARRGGSSMKVNIRVLDNTLQQFVLFAAGSLGLAASLDSSRVKVVGAAAIVFVVARLAFWIGYRIHPLYRAAGFAGTAYLNGALIVAALWSAAI